MIYLFRSSSYVYATWPAYDRPLEVERTVREESFKAFVVASILEGKPEEALKDSSLTFFPPYPELIEEMDLTGFIPRVLMKPSLKDF